MENQLCHFCDMQYPNPSCLMIEHNCIYACYNCNDIIQINSANQDGQCCGCFRYKLLIKLPNCTHAACVECCKTIYFEKASMERQPIKLRDDEPRWPYEFDDDDDGPSHIKYNEYCEFSDMHFDLSLSYDELITIRDNLISTRSEWMNEEAFINYENSVFLHYTTPIDSEKWWLEYEANKIRGTKSCPVCRA